MSFIIDLFHTDILGLKIILVGANTFTMFLLKLFTSALNYSSKFKINNVNFTQAFKGIRYIFSVGAINKIPKCL